MHPAVLLTRAIGAAVLASALAACGGGSDTTSGAVSGPAVAKPAAETASGSTGSTSTSTGNPDVRYAP